MIPVTDNYTNVFESKLRELNEKLTQTELAVARVNILAATNGNNVEKLNEKFNTTERELIQLKAAATTTENGVQKFKLHTASQLTELKSSVRTMESNVNKSKTEKIKFEGEFKLNILIVGERQKGILKRILYFHFTYPRRYIRIND
jgi:multidrug resistance efflux pump